MWRLLTQFAQDVKIDPSDIGVNDPITDPNTAVSGLLNTAYVAAGIVCVIIIIIGGYMYTTAAGDPGLLKKAREMIIGAVVGLIIIILAFTITQFIVGRFQ